jgi:uncharacterized protein YecE (DUF72 family)
LLPERSILAGVRVLTGTSGFSYDEWHGRFYPADLPAADRLAHYSSRLPSVEINNTFYQTPKAPLLERWKGQVTPEFRFALKAPRRITHLQRLKGSSDSLGYFWTAASALGEQLGPVLFQLPPFARKDAPLLAEFLAILPAGLRPAFEFRHESWYDDEIYGLLSARGAALCGGDAEDGDRSPPFVATTDFGYLRLRAPSYDAAGLRTWSERILGERWERAYVYLKHEVLGPGYAMFLSALATGTPDPPFPEPLAEPAPLIPKGRSRKPAAKKAPAATKAERAPGRKTPDKASAPKRASTPKKTVKKA